MPELVVQALIYFGATAGAVTTAIAYAITFATFYSVGNYQRRKAQRAARDAFNASLSDRLQMVALADQPRSRVYGRVRNVDGVLFKAPWGPDKRFYTLFVALAGHECDAIEQVYFGDVPVELDGSGNVTTAPYFITDNVSVVESLTLIAGAGNITLAQTPVTGSVSVTVIGEGGMHTPVQQVGGSFTVVGSVVTISGSQYNDASVIYQTASGKSYAKVTKYLGAPGQDLSGPLSTRMAQSDNPALVTATDKFEGICGLLVDLEYSTDVFPAGVPSISAVIRGAKVLDIRSGATVWTENPALIARDWSVYPNGGGLTASQYDDVACIETANVCDGDSSFTTPSGVVELKTYTCGIVCAMDGDPTQSLDEIIESMAGRRGWAGGKLRVMAGAYRIPVAEITEDWITDAKEIRVTKEPPRSELVNTYRVTFADKDNHYIPTPAPPLAPASYITADGQEYVREITALGITSSVHAQHVAGCLLRDARESLTIELPCNLRAFKLQLFESVEVTLPRYGWNKKVFEIMGWRFSQAGGVVLTLKETEQTIWQPDAGFADLGYTDNTLLPRPFDVRPLDWITVNSTVDFVDGQIITRTTVTWSPIDQINVLQSGFVEIQYQRLGAEGIVTWVDDDGNVVEWIENDEIAWTDGANPVAWVDGANVVTWQDGSTTNALEWTGDIIGDAGAWESLRERADNRSRLIAGLRAGNLYLFRARVITGLGVRSAWTTQVVHQIGAAPLVQTDYLAIGAATETFNLTAGTDSIVFSLGPDVGGDTTDTIHSQAYTNNTESTVVVQFDASFVDAEISGYNGSFSAITVDGFWEYTSTSSGAAATLFFSSLPDIALVGSFGNKINAAGFGQMSLIPGDTVTVYLKAHFAHNRGGTFRWNQSALRVTAIKR